LPAKKDEFIGAEARHFQYAYNLDKNATANDISKLTNWRSQTYGFGPKFRQLGALPENMTGQTQQRLESELLKISEYPEKPVEIDGKSRISFAPEKTGLKWKCITRSEIIISPSRHGISV
jgi:hypothetical protein